MMKLQSMEIGVHREISVIADLEEAAAEGEGGRDGTKVRKVVTLCRRRC